MNKKEEMMKRINKLELKRSADLCLISLARARLLFNQLDETEKLITALEGMQGE